MAFNKTTSEEIMSQVVTIEVPYDSETVNVPYRLLFDTAARVIEHLGLDPLIERIKVSWGTYFQGDDQEEGAIYEVGFDDFVGANLLARFYSTGKWSTLVTFQKLSVHPITYVLPMTDEDYSAAWSIHTTELLRAIRQTLVAVSDRLLAEETSVGEERHLGVYANRIRNAALSVRVP